MRIVIALGGNGLLRQAGTNVVPPAVPGRERR